MKKLFKTRILIFFTGIFLIVLNIIGMLTPLRNPDIYNEKRVGFQDDITLTEEQVYDILAKPYSTDEEFIRRVNDTVNKGIAHYWSDEGIEKYNLRVPIYENYMLFARSFISPTYYKRYEFSNYKKALERGVGLCSQQAVIVSGILSEHRIKTEIVGLSGHVVLMAQVDSETNTWWVLDPDYGVVIEHDIWTIQENPEIIRSYYYEKGYDSRRVNRLVEIYDSNGNVYVEEIKAWIGSERYDFEYLSYIGIWILPLLLLLLSYLRGQSYKEVEERSTPNQNEK